MPPSRSDLLATPLVQFGLGALALVVGAAVLFALIGLVSEGDPVASPPVVDNTSEPAPTTPEATSPGTDPATEPTATDPTTQPATEDPTADPTTPAESEIDPGTVSIQVLDAVGDSDQQHEAVMACLQEAGYGPLIANPAATEYEVTEVFYTPGEDNEAAARQVAATIGRSTVEEKPSNLSDTVPVHVVVGRDATDPC